MYKILDLLEKLDLDAMAKAEAIDQYYEHEPLWHEMKESMAHYDFLKAYQYLRAIVNSS